jgi:Flp pilus assembly protein TadG
MMRRLLSRLRHDRRGVATIELALYAPILATMTIGVIDLSNAFGRKLALEQAAQRSIERVMQTTADTTVEETIKAEAADQAGIPADEIDAKITVTDRLECNGVEEADFESSCDPGEDEARYLMVTVTDVYQPMFPLHFSGYDSSDGVQGYPIRAEAGMRTQ